jgi:hypothetical protein
METLYQYLLSLLKSVEDSFIAVLIMETLILLTKGLKKVKDVSQLCRHTLMIVYPTNSINLWATSSKEVIQTFFLKYMLHAIRTLTPQDSTESLIDIVDEMAELLNTHTSKSKTYPCLSDEDFGSVSTWKI